MVLSFDQKGNEKEKKKTNKFQNFSFWPKYKLEDLACILKIP